MDSSYPAAQWEISGNRKKPVKKFAPPRPACTPAAATTHLPVTQPYNVHFVVACTRACTARGNGSSSSRQHAAGSIIFAHGTTRENCQWQWKKKENGWSRSQLSVTGDFFETTFTRTAHNSTSRTLPSPAAVIPTPENQKHEALPDDVLGCRHRFASRRLSARH